MNVIDIIEREQFRSDLPISTPVIQSGYTLRLWKDLTSGFRFSKVFV